ncbi:MAG TPA: anti-sigma factor [Acidimicrobiales bacterium]|nr:anti-sigma factor [Acidimicrobiales bacterium]
MSSAEQHPFDEIAVYALDGLEPDERAVVEAHLAECPVCQAELDGHLATLARLTPDEPASPAVWARISESIIAEGDEVLDRPRLEAVPHPDAPAAEPRRRRGGAPSSPRHLARRRPWERIAGLAAAAVVLVAAAIGIGYVLGDRGEAPSSLADNAQDAINAGDPVATLATPDGEAVARVVVTDTGTGYFLADDLPTLEEGRTYQLWQLDGDQPISLGTLGDGTTAVTSVAVPAGTTTMAISAEAAGGAVSPTPDQIVAQGQAT